MTTKTITVKILSRWTNEPIYTTDIPADTPSGMQTRVALERAVSDRANLGGAYLGGAYLGDANLGGAYLGDANLGGANLRGANLGDANLGGANLRGANLGDANLGGAYLGDANLGGAYLGDASIWGTAGNCQQIKSLQLEIWPVAYTATHMQIGCQLHTLERWWGFSDEQINRMDSRALEWWGRWKPVLQQIVAMSPAEPGGEKPAEEPVEAAE